MAWPWRNLFSRSASGETAPADGGGGAPASPSPVAATPPWMPWGGAWPAYTGLSPENLSVVTAAIETIGSALASLPAVVYERLGGGEKREASQHPVSRLIAEPNPLMTWFDIVKFMMGDMLFYGNSVLAIERDGNGQPQQLLPVPWPACQPLLIPGANPSTPTTPGSRLVLDIMWTLSPYPLPAARPASAFPVRYLTDAGEVVFLRERASNAQIGVSRLARAAQVVELSLNAQGFAAATFAQGTTLSGTLTHPGRLSKEAMDNLAASWRDSHAGAGNASKVTVLEEAMKFEPTSMTLESAELAATREFQAVEIARIFQIPPPILGILDKTNFSTAEAAERFFATSCLTPLAVQIEQEFQRSVFLNDRYFLELDLSGLTRGTFNERAQTTINLTRAGLITQNEGRHQLGFDPIEGGDKLVMAASGGRPVGVEDGSGDGMPDPGALNGRKPANGSATTLQ